MSNANHKKIFVDDVNEAIRILGVRRAYVLMMRETRVRRAWRERSSIHENREFVLALLINGLQSSDDCEQLLRKIDYEAVADAAYQLVDLRARPWPHRRQSDHEYGEFACEWAVWVLFTAVVFCSASGGIVSVASYNAYTMEVFSRWPLVVRVGILRTISSLMFAYPQSYCRYEWTKEVICDLEGWRELTNHCGSFPDCIV